MTPPVLLEHLTALVAALERAPIEAADVRTLGDDDLLAATELGAKAHRLLDARTALFAGELARRSRPELAHEGLAQRTGHRTVEELVRAVRAGAISIGALDAIRTALDGIDPSVGGDALTSSVERLVASAAHLDVDRVLRLARHAREEIDAAALVDRERAQRDARSFRLWTLPDGMTRATWILGTGAPQVRVLVTAADVVRGDGTGSLEATQGSPEGTVVTLPTVQRLLCGGVQTPILIGATGQPLDVGRSQRLFTPRQRVALAARDGGCRWPGCERPPSWCEAHHIDEWERDRGRTDVDVGILLCRHHHLLLHDHGWLITRVGRSADYELVPPATVDPLHRPRPMPSRSREWQRALAG